MSSKKDRKSNITGKCRLSQKHNDIIQHIIACFLKPSTSCVYHYDTVRWQKLSKAP